VEQGDLLSDVEKGWSRLVRLVGKPGMILAASCVGILLGAAAIWLLSDELRPVFFPSARLDSEANAAQAAVSVEELGEILEAEIRARLQLGEELVELREEMRRLHGQGVSGVEQRPSEVQSYDDPTGDSVASADTSRRRSLPEGAGEDSLGSRGGALFDEAVLTRLGVYPRDAAFLRERWEQFEMEKLYLVDAATREGWLRMPRLRREMQAARATLQEELGDESFDLLLYASGQPNRVIIRSLLERSPAAEAGIEAGDVILSYDDRRVFRPEEFKRMTTSGSAGESVSVEIARQGRRISLTVPRGPLGVFMRVDTLAPELR
jgi:hypothetical protein